ncbi:MAG: hypothetical protein HY810_09065 [Candidatus Omnitrophica bacterium]|nr:hypothetical protein [Candidatus Omnitrophota bacterium]
MIFVYLVVFAILGTTAVLFLSNYPKNLITEFLEKSQKSDFSFLAN